MSVAAAADTHTVIWHFYNDPRLSPTAVRLIERELSVGNKIALSAISLAEVVYLVEKARIPPDAFQRLVTALERPDSGWLEVPFGREVAHKVLQVSRTDIPDMPDRIIAATALHLGVPLITRDENIRESSVPTIW